MMNVRQAKHSVGWKFQFMLTNSVTAWIRKRDRCALNANGRTNMQSFVK